MARCDELGVAPFSDSNEGLFRAWLTPAFRAAQDRVAGWMAAAGMAVLRDAAGNLTGHYAGTGDRTLLIGSHLDSVRDAGRYDGPLGIMLGIEAVAALHASGRRLPFAIEVVAFGDEEGSRFPAAMLTSRALAGSLPADALAVCDGEGIALPHALRGAGIDPAHFAQARRAPGTLLGYVEAHIEQGPVLEAAGRAVGTVTAIAAQRRHELRVLGQAGHAGTATMPLRRDALAGAAEMIGAIEAMARADASDLVATVGRIAAHPGAPNVIAGEITFSLDVRAGSDARRDRAADAMLAQCGAIAERRGLSLDARLVHELAAAPCDPALMDMMDAATRAAGLEPFRLVSGAGHDAMILADVCPIAMLFVRCRGGISHNPAEHVEPADADAALAVLSGFIERLGDHLGTA